MKQFSQFILSFIVVGLIYTVLVKPFFTDDTGTVTLYKDSVIIPNARLLIATFNSDEKALGGNSLQYNWENCQLASQLFQQQPDAKTRFWCEKGAYKE